MNLGSMVIGVIVSAVLLGFSFVQTFYYYTNRDSTDVFTAKGFALKTWVGLASIKGITVSLEALTTATSVLIACSLCWYLREARTTYKNLCALAALISVLASSTTLVFTSFYVNLGRLYTNSLLAALNAREATPGGKDDISHILVSMPSSTNNEAKKSQQTFAINVHTTHEFHQDPEIVDNSPALKIPLSRLPSESDMRKSHSYGEDDV
ncbi:hypothetical protein C0991_006174 [Blastosporella zonata]|nr:hypothetical protein C0991_006174 [Blastosporella zonata]